MIPLNDLKRSVTGESELQLKQIVEKVVLSGSYILGSEVKSFEEEFGSYLGVYHVTSVASGTDALVIALRSLGVARGSKVLVVPNAGGYTSTALFEIGAEPVFVDCDHMGRMDIESLKISLNSTPEGVCVVATHLYGLDSNIESILGVCKSFGISLLEDCAQSTGAEVGGKKLGSFGDVSTFSFYPTKNLGALGDAGAIATNSNPLALQHGAQRQYGWSSRYEVGTPYGKNSRMDEMQAAVLRFRLPQLDDLNRRRKEIWSSYEAALDCSDWRILGDHSTGFVAHLGILVAPEGLRDKAAKFLAGLGVATSVHYPILDYLQPGWADLASGDCRNAESLAQRILTIPLFPELSDEEVDAVGSALRAMITELKSNV
jgi:dTDP-3-amino-2,3,6-trideoxy-4-keto-D-glucose/dTDP-3-amino-3,4,6-trideoxy-alpha-D-glucose/dTDP-2,6-dideoxy-D-kanosamine transaminase